MRVVVTTSDDYVDLLRGFAHQWNKYCGLPVTVVYRNTPPPPLPENFTPVASPARYFDWTGSLRRALATFDDDLILLGLEDFWLSGLVDPVALAAHAAYMRGHPDVRRIDLTEDRSAYPYVLRDGYYQAVITPDQVEYLLSTQWSLWRRAYLIHVLGFGDGMIPPQFEVELSRIAARERPVILGTGYRVIPCHGDGVIWNGKLDNLHLDYLVAGDVAELRAKGFA